MGEDREARLLLALLREDWDYAAEAVRSGLPDPDRFTTLASRCDIHPWLHHLLEREDRWDLVGDRVRESLSDKRRKCRSDNLLLLARVEQVVDILLNDGIVPVALKGLDFLQRFYDRFDQRAMDDADILVSPDRVERTLELLEAAGYRAPTGDDRIHWMRSSYEIPLASPGPVPVSVEIHWGLGQEKRYNLSIEPILERAVPLEFEGRRILRLDDHDSAAHLLLHHLQHYFDRRLKWMLDLGRIGKEPGFEWRQVRARLEEWGGLAAGGMSLLHIEKLFPGMLELEAFDCLPAAAWRKLLTWPLRSPDPLDMFRWRQHRSVQLFLAGVLIDRPWHLPAYIGHMAVRDHKEGGGPVERDGR